MIVTDHFKTHFIPASGDRIMLVLHGKGDSVRPFKKFDKELRIPGMNYLLIQAPKKFLGGYSWYGDPPYQRDGVLQIRKKMIELLVALEKQGWKAKNIFLFGFSQGCLVSADVALHYPKKLGGVVGISGYFQFYPRWRAALEANRKTPWLFTHGRRDSTLPIETTKFGIEKLRHAGMKVDFIESDKEHVLEEKEYPTIRRWVQQQMQGLGPR